MRKRCARCETWKPTPEFYSDQGSKDGFASWCKVCRLEDEKERRLDPRFVARHRQRYEEDMYYRAKSLVGACRKRAAREGFAFDLTPHWMARKMLGRCELTDMEFDMSRGNRHLTPSIDRIKAGGGYTMDNCRVVVFGVNIALNNWGLEAFLPIAEALVRKQK